MATWCQCHSLQHLKRPLLQFSQARGLRQEATWPPDNWSNPLVLSSCSIWSAHCSDIISCHPPLLSLYFGHLGLHPSYPCLQTFSISEFWVISPGHFPQECPPLLLQISKYHQSPKTFCVYSMYSSIFAPLTPSYSLLLHLLQVFLEFMKMYPLAVSCLSSVSPIRPEAPWRKGLVSLVPPLLMS